MRRTSKLTTVNTARQPSAGHQLAPQQIQQVPPPGYGRGGGVTDYSQGGQVSWQQPVVTQGQGYSQPSYQQPPQPPSRQFQQAPQMEGTPQVIHRGKIQMKDAITLITLRLAKLEEMTSTPNFHSVLNGTMGGGDGDNNMSVELIESINDRLSGLESNMAMLFERSSHLHDELEEMKVNIQSIIDGTSIDHNDLIIQTSQIQDDTVDVFQNGTVPSTSITVVDEPNIIDTGDEDEDETEP
jgi:hypothetical protein